MKKLVLTVLTLALIAGAPALACGKEKAAQTADANFVSAPDTDVFYGVKGVTPQVENLENGVKIMVVSNDAKTLDLIEKRMGSCPISSGCGNCPLKGQNVKRTVERTDSGLVITATAENPEAVSKIQAYGASVAARAKAAS